MKLGNKHYVKDQGFTLAEVVIAVVIAAVFITSFAQLHITQSKISTTMVAYNNAELLAYNNLRIYAYGKAPTWFECTYSGGLPEVKTVFSSSDAVSGIPSPVSQTVVATAPYGCGGGSAGIGYPIKVVSTVTYGPSAKAVVHATYATY